MLSKECLIKCKGLPPKRLYHLVLPVRFHKKILFCLCMTCAVECSFSGECLHKSTAQSSVTSMWIPNEVRLAIQNCYKDRDIMEVYEYEETNYDPHTREE